MLKPTTDIKRHSPDALLAGLRSENASESIAAAEKLVLQARDYGLNLRDFLRLSIDPRLADADQQHQYLAAPDKFVNGYEAALAFLSLPVRDDLESGVTLQLAADTFQTFPGTRALFPEVIDDVVQWKYRLTNFETTDGLISQRRTISGNEILTTVVNDTAADYDEGVGAVAEGGQVPIHSIRTSQKSTKMWKFGEGYKMTYEFQRRASLDLLTPYAIRTQRRIDRSKVGVAVSTLLNGDGLAGAAPVVGASSFNTQAGSSAVSGKLSWKHLTAWLVARAQAGVPIDTIAGNWDMYLQWLFMFAVPSTNGASMSDAEVMARTGYQLNGIPILSGEISFKLASDAPANQMIGFSRGDTLEELVEAGSLISESERSIRTQEVTLVRTETSGYRIVFDDTRSVLDLAS